MGKFIIKDRGLVYQQDDGEITAWLNGFEEIMELPHEGTPRYKKIFYFLVIIGIIYLMAVFVLL